MFDCILKNAVVVTPQKAQKLTIAVKNEKIAGLFSPDINLSAKEEFDFSGKIISPGLSIPMLMLHSAAILIPVLILRLVAV